MITNCDSRPQPRLVLDTIRMISTQKAGFPVAKRSRRQPNAHYQLPKADSDED